MKYYVISNVLYICFFRNYEQPTNLAFYNIINVNNLIRIEIYPINNYYKKEIRKKQFAYAKKVLNDYKFKQKFNELINE